MKKPIIQIIKETSDQARELETGIVEYNLELPEDENITKDSFYGVKAIYNPRVAKGTATVTYKM